jgi:hypothetical protein
LFGWRHGGAVGIEGRTGESCLKSDFNQICLWQFAQIATAIPPFKHFALAPEPNKMFTQEASHAMEEDVLAICIFGSSGKLTFFSTRDVLSFEKEIEAT